MKGGDKRRGWGNDDLYTESFSEEEEERERKRKKRKAMAEKQRKLEGKGDDSSERSTTLSRMSALESYIKLTESKLNSIVKHDIADLSGKIGNVTMNSNGFDLRLHTCETRLSRMEGKLDAILANMAQTSQSFTPPSGPPHPHYVYRPIYHVPPTPRSPAEMSMTAGQPRPMQPFTPGPMQPMAPGFPYSPGHQFAAPVTPGVTPGPVPTTPPEPKVAASRLVQLLPRPSQNSEHIQETLPYQ